jgi:hypothetical protein
MDHANIISHRVSEGQIFSACDHVTESHVVNKFTPEVHTRSIVLVMNTQQILVIAITVAALISAVLVSLLLPPNAKTTATTTVFQEPKNNKIQDSRGDAKLIPLYKTDIYTKVRDYHDILSAEVNKINDDGKSLLLLTIDLAGDANKNEKYETVYLWLINYTDSLNATAQKTYTVIIPNFAVNSNFKNKSGWYLAIFNNTNNAYTLPLSKISDMPKNKVQAFIDPDFIGNPPSFNYIVSVMVRVNNTFLDKPPDYLLDSVPDNNNELFWIRWFSR